MGLDTPDNPAERMLPLSDVLEFLDRACERVGLDEDRRKMMRQIFIFGEPVTESTLEPLPDVEAMRMALETAQTWFNLRPDGSARLNADLLIRMRSAGYAIEGAL